MYGGGATHEFHKGAKMLDIEEISCRKGNNASCVVMVEKFRVWKGGEGFWVKFVLKLTRGLEFWELEDVFGRWRKLRCWLILLLIIVE